MEKKDAEYEVYKGLQKPLIFKGIKGKFIYWMAGGIISSFILAFIINYFFGTIISIIVAMCGIGGIIFYCTRKQKEEGIYSRDKTRGIVYVENNYKFKKIEKD